MRPRRRAPPRRVRMRRVMRRPRRPAFKVHSFKRTCKLDNVQASITNLGVGSGISAAYQFTLDSLPNYQEFTSLYDLYKINGIKLSFVPSASEYINSTTSSVTGQNGFQRFHTVLDFDDTSVPVSENELLQYTSLKSTPGWATHSRYFKPRVNTVVEGIVGATLAASSTAPKWISTQDPSVEHLGVKVFVPPPIAGANIGASITYTVYATYYLSCRNVK